MSWSNWFLSLKILLISSGVLSLAMAMKFSVPLIINFIIHQVPLIWSVVLSLLKPPYLYLIVNGIIITIAAASRFTYKLGKENETQYEQAISAEPLPISEFKSDFTVVSAQTEVTSLELPAVVYESFDNVSDVKPAVVKCFEPPATATEEKEDLLVLSTLSKNQQQRTSSLETPSEFLRLSEEKPLVSTRFGHRKPIKASPEGGRRALKVAKQRKHDTLENTWMTITEGRHVPLSRHLRKSERWENPGRQAGLTSAEKVTTKHVIETVRKDSGLALSSVSQSPSRGKVRREPSMSQDELNRRVEAFIKKFNENMRLQRQESWNQYMEMIKHEAH